MSISRIYTGGCQCGAVRYRAEGTLADPHLCHCRMCQKAAGNYFMPLANAPRASFRITRGEPSWFYSSEVARRGFCAACGTQVSFTASFLPGLIDITIGSLDRPEAIPPTLHYWHAEHLSWAEFADDLPRHKELPPFG